MVSAIDRQKEADEGGSGIEAKTNIEGGFDATLDPGVLVGAIVLAGKSQDRGSDSVSWNHQEVDDLAGCAITELGWHGGEHRTVGVDVEANDRVLHDDDADGKDAILETQWETILDMTENGMPGNTEVFLGQTEVLVTEIHIQNGSDCRDTLTDDGGECTAGNAPMEDGDEEQIQEDVEDGGGD